MAANLRSLQSRFQGCITGALFGDCIGEKFERLWMAKPLENVIKYVKEIKQKGELRENGKGFVPYTDDSCMTFDLGEMLLKLKRFEPLEVAKRFAKTYHSEPAHRYYGGQVVDVFEKLMDSDFTCDPFGPASEQFDGRGSYSNGSAMRVSPVPLFAHGDSTEIAYLAKLQSMLTHTHPQGVDGAVLQALAINKAIKSEKIDDPVKFCKELVEQLKTLSECPSEVGIYKEKMDLVVKLLTLGREVTPREVDDIGMGVVAKEAVPAAIFCFLYTLDRARVQQLVPYEGLVRTIVFASAVSMDSDTVASMAGAIAGAYYGFEEVPAEWMTACEGADKALKMANDLYEINEKNKRM